MMQYSLLDRRPEEESLDLLQQHSIGVLARGSVASGLLINKPPKPYLNYSAEEVKKAADAILSVSLNKQQPAQTAIQFVLQHPALTSAVVGIRTAEQLDEALQAATETKMADHEYQFLANSIRVNHYEQHR
jgi:aryl-alcohol dehydrogenase-like predicted oxidoreductase